MAGICGWVNNQADSAPPDLNSMAAALARFDGARPQTAVKPGCGLAAAELGAGPFLAEDDHLLIGFSGAPHFASRDLNELARARGRAAALAEGYRRWQGNLASHLLGQYAIAIIDQN